MNFLLAKYTELLFCDEAKRLNTWHLIKLAFNEHWLYMAVSDQAKHVATVEGGTHG